MSHLPRATAVIAFLALAPACAQRGAGPDAGSDVLEGLAPIAVADTTTLLAFAEHSSATGVWATVALPVFAATASSNGCPSIVESDDGNSVIVEGDGCYDEDGKRWTGRLHANGDVDVQLFGTATYRFEDLTFTYVGVCGTSSLSWSGRASLVSSEELYRLDVDLRQDAHELDASCMPRDVVRGFDYAIESRAVPDGPDIDTSADGTSWSGHGRIGIAGLGRVDAETLDEADLVDGCDAEMDGGRTEIRGAGHVSVIEYDGAADCDDPPTIRWSFDGTDQGEVAGIACSIASIEPFGGMAMLLLGVAWVVATLYRW